jgi:hypothetical protein
MKIQKYILIVLSFFACVVPVIAQEKKTSLPIGAQPVIIDGPTGRNTYPQPDGSRFAFRACPGSSNKQLKRA